MYTMNAFITLILLINHSFGQINIGPTSDVYKICASGSLHSEVDGTFTYLQWDSTRNGGIFYNNITSQYLYPHTDESYRYMIGPHIGNSFANAYSDIGCQSSEYVANMTDFVKNWKYYSSGSGIEDDPDLRLVDCDDVCVTGSAKAFFDGVYRWSYFNRIINAPVYFCEACSIYEYRVTGVYIFPWVYVPVSSNQYWKMGPNDTDSASWSYCSVYNYNWNVTDCDRWRTWDYPNYIDDTTIIVAECKTPTASPTDAPVYNPYDTTISCDTTISPTNDTTISPTNDTVVDDQQLQDCDGCADNGCNFMVGVATILLFLGTGLTLFVSSKNKQLQQRNVYLENREIEMNVQRQVHDMGVPKENKTRKNEQGEIID